MPLPSYQTIKSLIPNTSGKIYVAYSGGIDSAVLLHLCASQTEFKTRIYAVYVNHGLQAEAASWGVHCRQQATLLGVEFIGLEVNAKAGSRESPEAAARKARYQALEK